jgi:hypothetical protein
MAEHIRAILMQEQEHQIDLATGSVFEESVSFTQQGVFTMQSYHLVQSGPAFGDDIDAELSHSGKYVVHARSHKNGVGHDYSGTLSMPGDVYNGMEATVAKNISTRQSTSMHVVAFTPEPRMVDVVFAPTGTQRVSLGTHEETAVDFTVKPQLGAVMNVLAKLTRQLPPETHVWIITDDVPAFARSAGPMYTGPVWRIALASPQWPK